MMQISFFKYCVVGLSGLVVDFSLTYVLKEELDVNKYFASIVGFSVACSSNYIFNRIWTFCNNNPEIIRQYASFITISIIGLVLNTSLLYLFQRLKVKYYFSKALAITFVTIWNYIANSMITFG